MAKTWVQQADTRKSQKGTSALSSYFCSMVGIEKKRRKVCTVDGIILNRRRKRERGQVLANIPHSGISIIQNINASFFIPIDLIATDDAFSVANDDNA